VLTEVNIATDNQSLSCMQPFSKKMVAEKLEICHVTTADERQLARTYKRA